MFISENKEELLFFPHHYLSEMYSSAQEELLSAPHAGPVYDLTVAYFNNIINEKRRIVRETHREAKRTLDTASNFLK